MNHIKHCFDRTILDLKVEKIRVLVPLKKQVLQTPKFRSILSSVRELGIIEPLAVHPSQGQIDQFDLLDGRLRLEAVKILGQSSVRCMVALDDESFTYNKQINRIASVQEYRMIR